MTELETIKNRIQNAKDRINMSLKSIKSKREDANRQSHKVDLIKQELDDTIRDLERTIGKQNNGDY